ncbi:hypothetical protein QNI16_19080 [Cytophagaceae bacterium YF14B1]|uniref:Uncharacterized protein n=1 Tax=Xanthocytophaga flava TaxID=3048013 RepID=A0AAE3U8F6_9BACT|nr:hypothetical protein [Xanthocytophaga flavus]MDJ1482612.1 hypothetical protein [Xanthocytophaga flavus]
MAGDSEIMVEQISDNPQPGYYSGMGRVSMRFLAGAAFRVSLSNIFVNEDRKITQGKVEMLSRGVDAMAQQQLAAQAQREKERQQATNREQWKNTDFYENIIRYDDLVIDTMRVNAGIGNINQYLRGTNELPVFAFYYLSRHSVERK